MKRIALLAGAAAVAVGIVAAVAFAGDTGPISPNAESVTYVAGNPQCPNGLIQGPKIDPGANGTYAINGVNGVMIKNYDGKTFDWELIGSALNVYDMAAVVVKGGPNANVYWYDYTGGGLDDEDTGLHSPVNPNNDKYYGISHIQFCVDPKGTPQPGA
jgi:hypothetical protein